MRVYEKLRELCESNPNIHLASYSILYGFIQSRMGEVIYISDGCVSSRYVVIYPLKNEHGKIVRDLSVRRMGVKVEFGNTTDGVANQIFLNFIGKR